MRRQRAIGVSSRTQPVQLGAQASAVGLLRTHLIITQIILNSQLNHSSRMQSPFLPWALPEAGYTVFLLRDISAKSVYHWEGGNIQPPPKKHYQKKGKRKTGLAEVSY